MCIADEKRKPVTLKTLVKQKHEVDRWVYIGSDRKVLFRLVMIPMPAAQMAERVRKAKNHRDARLNRKLLRKTFLFFNNFFIAPVNKIHPGQRYQCTNAQCDAKFFFENKMTQQHCYNRI